MCALKLLSDSQLCSFIVSGSQARSISNFRFFFWWKYCLDTVCKNVRKVLPGPECLQSQEVVRHWLLAHWGMLLSPETPGLPAGLETRHRCCLHQMRTPCACGDSPPSPPLQRESQGWLRKGSFRSCFKVWLFPDGSHTAVELEVLPRGSHTATELEALLAGTTIVCHGLFEVWCFSSQIKDFGSS